MVAGTTRITTLTTTRSSPYGNPVVGCFDVAVKLWVSSVLVPELAGVVAAVPFDVAAEVVGTTLASESLRVMSAVSFAVSSRLLLDTRFASSAGV